jgi:hypothetical protein
VKQSLGPGTYDSPIKAINTTSAYTFSKNVTKTTPSRKQLGPGLVDISPVKARAPAHTFSKVKRGSEVSKSIVGLGPGSYDQGKQFNANSKSFKFVQSSGAKRTPVARVGPGYYNTEAGEKITKPKA